MIDEPPMSPDESGAESAGAGEPHPAIAPPEPEAEPPSTTPKSGRGARFVVPLIAVVILAVGLTSFWWLPLVRTAEHGPAAPRAVAEPEPARPAARVVTAPATPDGPSTAQLAARIDRLDEAVSALQDNTGSSNSKADLDNLDQRINALSQRLEAVVDKSSADPQQLAALADTVKQLGDRLSAINGQLQRQDDARQNGAALVLAASEIATAVASGASYGGALQVLKSLDDDSGIAQQLAVLGRFENTVIDSRTRLLWDLRQLPPRFDEAVELSDDTGFWHRILARMARLVRIHKTAEADDGEGKATPASAVEAAETELVGGDLGAAIQSMETLRGHPAELSAPWLEQARDRLQLEQASQSLQSLALQKLGSAAGAQP